MSRRACAPSSDDLTFFFDPWHAPLAEAARTLAMAPWPEGEEDPHAVAKQLAAAGHSGVVVTVLCDRGDRYFAPLRWEQHYVW